MSLDLFWDDNGNLAQVSSCKQDYVRSHVWDEENRLRAMLSPGRSGYYGYDGNGERIYKLVGNTQYTVINASLSEYGIIFDDLTVYPSPYMVLSSHGYTKHFYSGTERIATLLGEGGLVAPTVSLDSLRCASVVHGWYSLSDALQTMSVSGCTQNTDIAGNYVADLQYCSTSVGLSQVQIIDYIGQSLDSILLDWQTCGGGRNDVFFTHPDHLGSASWITDKDGLPVQYIHYAPYGEFVANQQKIGYDERFKFTGKERDEESGYDFFGARYYDHRKGFWNSVDPLADKYPNETPYLYCGGNPVMLVDPDGMQGVAAAGVVIGGTVEHILGWTVVGAMIAGIGYGCYSYTSEMQENNIQSSDYQESLIKSNLVEQNSSQVDFATNNSDVRNTGRWRQKQQAEQNRRLLMNMQNVEDMMPSSSPDPNNDDNNKFSKWLKNVPRRVKVLGGVLVGGQLLEELEKFIAPFIEKFQREQRQEHKVEGHDNNKSIIEQQ